MYSVREITRFEYSWLKSAYFHNLYSQLTKSTLLSQKEFETLFMDIYKNDNIKLFGILYLPWQWVNLKSLRLITKNYEINKEVQEYQIDSQFKNLKEKMK